MSELNQEVNPQERDLATQERGLWCARVYLREGPACGGTCPRSRTKRPARCATAPGARPAAPLREAPAHARACLKTPVAFINVCGY